MTDRVFSNYYSDFHELPIGVTFSYNGNDYVKQSTRTALMLDANRVFYMGMRDICFKMVQA
jgi:hypothetical protein